MTKYKVWTHIDTGIEQTIDADSENEALRIADERIDMGMVEDFDIQVMGNMQCGETDVVTTIDNPEV